MRRIGAGSTRAIGRTALAVIAVVVIIVAGAAAYLYINYSSTPNQVITIGLSIPTSFAVGQDAQDAANMAVSQINSNGGVLINGTHYTVKTVTEDTDEMDWTIPVNQGVSAFQKLMTVDGANVVLGGVRTDVVVAQSSYLSQYKKVFVDVESNEPIVEQEVRSNYTNYKYYFHLFVNGSAIGPSLVKFPIFLRNYTSTHSGWGNVSNVAILGEDALWTVGPVGRPAGNSSFVGALKHSGFNVVYSSLFPLNTNDFSTYLNAMAADHVGMIILFFSGTDGVSFATQWSQYNWPGGVKPVVFGPGLIGGCSEYWSQTGGAAQGMIPWPSTVNASFTAKTVPFIDSFYKNYGHTPNTMALDMYDAVYLVTQAMSTANSWSADKLIPVMESMTYTGVTGTIHFTSSHGMNLPEIPMYQQFGQWQNGVLVPIWNSTSTAISPKIVTP